MQKSKNRLCAVWLQKKAITALRYLGMILLAHVCAGIAFAQNDVGSIVGFVTDASGAVIPGARVTVTNEGTGETRVVTSDAQGHFAAPNLAPAVYTLAAEAKGFNKFSSAHNRLASNSTVEINAQLNVGAETQTVTVTDTAVVLQTQSSAIQSEVTGAQVQKQELNGRNPIYMTQFLPGVVSSSTTGDFNFQFNNGASFAVNGARTNDTRYIIDGAMATRTRGDSQIIAGANVDSVQEMQVMTGDYSAEYGSASGAQVRIVTKSGTRNFHGAGYEYLRNSAMNANTWVRNLTPSTQFASPFVYNNFGFAVGGPAWLPKLPHKWRDRIFFFVNEDWIRYRFGQPQTMSVPTDFMRKGDFHELLSADPNVNPWYKGGIQLYDPSTCPKVGTPGCVPIPNNDLSTYKGGALLSPNGLGILASYPEPTPGFLNGTSNYNGSLPDPENQRKGQINIDLLVHQSHHIEFRRSDDTFYQIQPFNQSNPQVPLVWHRPNQANSLGWEWTISPTMINELRASVSVDDVYIGAQPGGAGYDRGQFGINFAYILPGQKASENKIPTASVPAFSSIAGGPYPSQSSGIISAISDSFTKVWGNHNLKFGVFITDSGENDNDQINVSTVPGGASNQNGTFIFTDGHSGGTGTTGAGLVNLAAGLADSYTEIGPKAYTKWRGWTFEYFAQDGWQINSKLHFDYGLRITTALPVAAAWGNADFFDPGSYVAANAPVVNPFTGNITLGTGNAYNGVVIPGLSSFPSGATQNNRVPAANPANNACAGQPCTGLFNPSLPRRYVSNTTQVQPRLGFAYQMWNSTVIRAGLGRFVTNKGLLDNVFPGGNSPFQPTVTVSNVSVDNPGANVTTGVEPAITLTTLASNLVPPSRWNWNLAVEHEFAPLHSVFQVSYVGARGLHNWNTVDINQAQPGALQAAPSGTSIQYLRPYKGFASIQQEQSGVSATYGSLQTSWNTNLGSGTSVGVSYTWSKSMDGGSNYRDIIPDSYSDNGYLWGPSEFDVRNIFIANALYVLPFFKNRHNLAGEVLGGWQLSGNVQAQTGMPCGVGTNNEFAGVGEVGSFGCGTEGQFYVKNAEPHMQKQFGGATGTGGKWFSTTYGNGSPIFTPPPAGTFNHQNGIRDNIYMPGLQNWNAALIKSFPITEGIGFEFRAEAYNFINHPNWDKPNFTPTSSSFGQVTAKTTTNPRTLQVGARIHF
jgi:hypothetical protein